MEGDSVVVPVLRLCNGPGRLAVEFLGLPSGREVVLFSAVTPAVSIVLLITEDWPAFTGSVLDVADKVLVPAEAILGACLGPELTMMPPPLISAPLSEGLDA